MIFFFLDFFVNIFVRLSILYIQLTTTMAAAAAAAATIVTLGFALAFRYFHGMSYKNFNTKLHQIPTSSITQKEIK